MEMSGEIGASAYLPPGESFQYALYWKLNGPQCWSGLFGGREKAPVGNRTTRRRLILVIFVQW
jgi:hypothetical protein